MSDAAPKRDIAVSMRFRDEDLDLIDRGADLAGLSRTEFVRRAALHEAQMVILNETIVRLSPDAFKRFVAAIEAPAAPLAPKMRERLERRAPWENAKA